MCQPSSTPAQSLSSPALFVHSFIVLLTHFITRSLEFARARLQIETDREMYRWSIPLTFLGKLVASQRPSLPSAYTRAFPSITTTFTVSTEICSCLSCRMYLHSVLVTSGSLVRWDFGMALLRCFQQAKVGTVSPCSCRYDECL
jgi:hypothetical protein